MQNSGNGTQTWQCLSKGMFICFNSGSENAVFQQKGGLQQWCETKEKVHDVLVINWARKGAESGGKPTI